jgi:NitT/TauT family transport system substrate-binding protein
MITRRSFVYGGLATGSLLTTMVSCGQPSNAAPLRIGLIDWPGYELFHLAQSLNFYGNTKDHAPIELVNYNDITALLRAYRQQSVQCACVTLNEVLQLASTQADQRVIMAIDESAGADAILAKPSIKTLADLKGKRVASDLTALSGYMLVSALEQAKLTLNDIQIVTLGMGDHLEAYKADRCDAVITFEPFRTQLLQSGAQVLFDSRQIPGAIVDVLLTSQPILQKYTSTLKVLTDGFFKAFDYLNQNSQDAIARMAAREKVSSDDFASTLKLLKLADRSTNRTLLNPDNSPLIPVINKLNKIMVDRKLLPQAIESKSLLTSLILPPP